MQTPVLCQRIMIKIEPLSPARFQHSPEGLFSKIDVMWSVECQLNTLLIEKVIISPLQRYGTITMGIMETIIVRGNYD